MFYKNSHRIVLIKTSDFFDNNFQKITFFISTEIAYKILYNNLAGGKIMEILRKKNSKKTGYFKIFMK